MAAWQLVANTTYGDFSLRLDRLTVPGGWEVRYLVTKISNNSLILRSFYFVDDVSHAWVIAAWVSLGTEVIGINTIQMDRMSIPGGWFFRQYSIITGGSFSPIQFSFLEDASHIWSFVAWQLATLDLINGYNCFTHRLNIPGGWYVRNIFTRDLTHNILGIQISSLDDAAHTWVL